MTIRVLLFVAHFGDGHRQVASALRAAFEREGVEVKEIDCMRSAHPKFAKLNEASFELTTRYLPHMYGFSYIWTRRLPNNSFLWRMLSIGARQTAEAAIAEFSPDAVLQLFPEHTLVNLKTSDSCDSDSSDSAPWSDDDSDVLSEGQLLPTDVNHRAKRPVSGVVLTDFSTHSRWFCPNTDVYYLPHDSFLSDAKKLAKSSKDDADFVVSGIPLREQFMKQGPRANGHILVATGGRGVFSGLTQVLTTLYERRNGRDVIVMCGRNEAMRSLVEELSADKPDLVALPFVEEVAPLLQSAAFAVIKPGGVTVAECLASGCPMLFYRPPLGQELDNARWVTRFGAGKIANNMHEFEAAATFLSQSENSQRAARAAQDLGRADAAKNVVQDIMTRLSKRR